MYDASASMSMEGATQAGIALYDLQATRCVASAATPHAAWYLALRSLPSLGARPDTLNLPGAGEQTCSYVAPPEVAGGAT